MVYSGEASGLIGAQVVRRVHIGLDLVRPVYCAWFLGHMTVVNCIIGFNIGHTVGSLHFLR